MDNTCLENWFWFGPNHQQDCILYSRLGFHRSLKNELFPHRASPEDKEGVLNNVLAALKGLEIDPYILIGPESSRDCQLSAREVFDIPEVLTLKAGEAVFIGEKAFLATINIHSHINFSLMGPGSQPLEQFQDLVAIDTQLDKRLSWACTETYGFLNPDPIHTGSGMEFEALLFLPGIIDSDMYDRVMKGLLAQGFAISVYDTKEQKDEEDLSQQEIRSPFIQLTYTVPLGVSEQEGLEKITNALEGLMKGERATRERLAEKLSEEIKDKSWRAYALLTHAQLLSKTECRSLISDLRAGIVYGSLPMSSAQGILKDCDRLWFGTETLVRQALEAYPADQRSEKLSKSLRSKLVRNILSQYHIEGEI
ncbi:hypothetical protein [Gracilinema caldarium]|uniref:hypothetical protein n=1 Tax=Gracilinema caldarium TaxID=215591 RepID=UPI0026EAE097|nr:hypothetical protein [Gracilinema caldarium]